MEIKTDSSSLSGTIGGSVGGGGTISGTVREVSMNPGTVLEASTTPFFPATGLGPTGSPWGVWLILLVSAAFLTPWFFRVKFASKKLYV